MNKLAKLALIIAIASSAVPAVAQSNDGNGSGRGQWGSQDGGNNGSSNGQGDIQNSRNWRDYRNYDHNRLESGTNRYYADRYYRHGRYYRNQRLAANDRIYRGQDQRYYCRRPDGTTGLIIGGLAGGLLGNILAPGDSGTLGTLLGAGGGAVAGRAIQRHNVHCD